MPGKRVRAAREYHHADSEDDAIGRASEEMPNGLGAQQLKLDMGSGREMIEAKALVPGETGERAECHGL